MTSSNQDSTSARLDVDEAAAAAGKALGATSRKALREASDLVNPRLWGRHYPKSATAASSATGLLVGFVTAWRLRRRKARGKAREKARRARIEEGPRIARPRADATVHEGRGSSWLASGLSLVARSVIRAATRHVLARRARSSGRRTAGREDSSSAGPNEDVSAGSSGRAFTEWSVPSRVWWLARRTVAEFWNDQTFRTAAALSYYTVFSLAPLLVIATAVAGFALQKNRVEDAVLGEVESLIGPKGREFVAHAIARFGDSSANLTATAVGAVMILIGASAVFRQLQLALNRIWNVPPRKTNGLFGIIRDRLLSFALVLGLGFLLLLSLLVSAAIQGFDTWIRETLEVSPVALQWLTQLGGFLIITALFAMIYKWLPDVRLTWTEVGVGAVVTAMLFFAGKSAIGVYLGNAAISSTYGAAASVVVVLIWSNYSALAFLLGARFTHVYATRPGADARRRGDPYLRASLREQPPDRL